MTDEQIKHMVNRFLGWRLPENFRPDAGISFKPTFNDHMPFGPQKYNPSGTNLFDAEQTEAMVRYMVEGMDPRTSNHLFLRLGPAIIAQRKGPEVYLLESEVLPEIERLDADAAREKAEKESLRLEVGRLTAELAQHRATHAQSAEWITRLRELYDGADQSEKQYANMVDGLIHERSQLIAERDRLAKRVEELERERTTGR